MWQPPCSGLLLFLLALCCFPALSVLSVPDVSPKLEASKLGSLRSHTAVSQPLLPPFLGAFAGAHPWC